MRLQVGATQSDTQMDTSDLESAQRDLRKLASAMPRAAVRALNETMKKVPEDVKNVISGQTGRYNIKAGAIKKRISIVKRASKGDITGVIKSKGGLLGLTSDLNTPTSQTKRGVTVNVKKSTGRQLFPRAFIRPGRNSGKLIVLRRPGQPRGQTENLYPRYGPPGSAGKVGSQATLDAFYGPHPETLINAPENWAKIQTKVGKRLDTNITREVDSEFRHLGGK